MFSRNGIATFDRDTQLVTLEGFRFDYPKELIGVSDATLLRHLTEWGSANGFPLQTIDGVEGFDPEILGFWHPSMLFLNSQSKFFKINHK